MSLLVSYDIFTRLILEEQSIQDNTLLLTQRSFLKNESQQYMDYNHGRGCLSALLFDSSALVCLRGIWKQL